MPLVDRGGRWHATIPRKGNRWLPMPDFLLAQLDDMIDRQPNNEKIRKDFKDLGLRSRNVGRLLAKGDVVGAQAKVQTLVDKFPWATFADLVESNHNEELGQVEKLEEGLQAFIDVDPHDFLDLVKPGAVVEPEAPKVEAPKVAAPSASKKAYEDIRKTIFMGTPLPLDDPRQRAWDSAGDNMSDTEKEMGKDFPAEWTDAWYDLFMSSYHTALEMHQAEKDAEDLRRQEQDEADRLAADVPPSAPKEGVRPAGWLKEQFEKGYKRDNTVHLPQGNKGIVELGYVADGTKIVLKRSKTETEAVREAMAARIAQLMGIDFHAERVGVYSVAMNFVEGEVGATWARNQHRLIPLDPNLSHYDALFERSKKIAAAATELPNAKEIGLLDYLIGNEDRHDGNWILGTDGKMYPIDHGLAQFSDQSKRIPSEKAVFYGSDFTQAALGVERDQFDYTGKWDPSKKWTHAELEDIKTGLTDLRRDPEFRARKRWIDEALKRIDIVIAKMPPKPEPVPEAVPEVVAPAKAVRKPGHLKEQYKKGYKKDDLNLPQGQMSTVELGTLADGTRVVKKTAKRSSEVEREVLAARVAQVLGIDFNAEAIGTRQLLMDYIEGESGGKWITNHRDPNFVPGNPEYDNMDPQKRYDKIQAEVRVGRESALKLQNVKQIGLLDFLIANGDRHTGNWIVRDGVAYPIDHGLAMFSDSGAAGTDKIYGGYFSEFTNESLGYNKENETWDPSKHWTMAELLDIKAGIDSLEEDFAKRPEWFAEVKHRIDVTISSMPANAKAEQGPAAVRPVDHLKSAFEEGYTPTEDKIFQGNTATVEIGVVADGTQVVRKVVKQELEADTEYLAGLVANTLGVGPVTAKVGPNEIVMEYVADAKTGNGWMNANAQNFKPDYRLRQQRGGWEKAERDRYARMFQHMVEMPGGKEIGLLDFLIDNHDRHAGNWMIKDDKAVPIDNGNARWHTMRYIDEHTGKEVEQFPDSPFATYWLGAKLTRYGTVRRMDPQKHWTAQELADIRSKIQDLRADFIDHPDWHDAMLEKIDRLLGNRGLRDDAKKLMVPA